MAVRSFHASSTYFRKFASAFGAGSVATTFNPRARYSAAQLAPMTPVPTIATFLTSRLFVAAILILQLSSLQIQSLVCSQSLNWLGVPLPLSYPVVQLGWRR